MKYGLVGMDLLVDDVLQNHLDHRLVGDATTLYG